MDLPIGTDHHAAGGPVLPADPIQPEEDPPVTIYDEEVPVERGSIIYVIDVSGSMASGWEPYTNVNGHVIYGNRLSRAKAELHRSIAALPVTYRFNVVAYDCSIQPLHLATVKATDENKAEAFAWVNSLRARSATGTGPAGAVALRDLSNDTIILLTDGEPNCGAEGFAGHRAMIRAANTHGATMHTVGIQIRRASATAFLQSVAADNGGRYYPIS